jgi:hypothetical protein
MITAACTSLLHDLGVRAALQLLREAASRGGHMAHAAGTSPPPPTAPLGASGAETMKEFEVSTCGPCQTLKPPCSLTRWPSLMGHT